MLYSSDKIEQLWKVPIGLIVLLFKKITNITKNIGILNDQQKNSSGFTENFSSRTGIVFGPEDIKRQRELTKPFGFYFAFIRAEASGVLMFWKYFIDYKARLCKHD